MDFDSSKQTSAWFRDRYREGSLTIKPPYQRNPVWGMRQKCYLIESILMGLPIPEIYVQRSTTEEGENTFGLVDGQQRIRAVLQFMGSETEEGELDYNRFTLDYLAPQSPWYNMGFRVLSS